MRSGRRGGCPGEGGGGGPARPGPAEGLPRCEFLAFPRGWCCGRATGCPLLAGAGPAERRARGQAPAVTAGLPGLGCEGRVVPPGAGGGGEPGAPVARPVPSLTEAAGQGHAGQGKCWCREMVCRRRCLLFLLEVKHLCWSGVRGVLSKALI